MWAAGEGEYGTASILIRRLKAEVNVFDHRGNSALSFAIYS